jgi:hypothetical protein
MAKCEEKDYTAYAFDSKMIWTNLVCDKNNYKHKEKNQKQNITNSPLFTVLKTVYWRILVSLLGKSFMCLTGWLVFQN